jgi:hypothetical protein
MSDAQTEDAFDLVVASLTAQRDRIDQTIATLRMLKASGFSGAAALGTAELLGTQISDIKDSQDRLGPGAFLGLTIVDAAKKLLAHERRQLSNSEITEALKRGGLVLNSADPINTIGSVMTRRFQQIGDVVRVGRGIWGLKEWYPNRSFKAVVRADEGGSGSGGRAKYAVEVDNSDLSANVPPEYLSEEFI